MLGFDEVLFWELSEVIFSLSHEAIQTLFLPQRLPQIIIQFLHHRIRVFTRQVPD
jgi:hypothetical protein